MTTFIISIGCSMCTQPVKYIISISLLIFIDFYFFTCILMLFGQLCQSIGLQCCRQDCNTHTCTCVYSEWDRAKTINPWLNSLCVCITVLALPKTTCILCLSFSSRVTWCDLCWHCACAMHEHSGPHYWIKWHIQQNVHKSSVESKIICSQVMEVLRHLIPPCHTHLEKWLSFFLCLIVPWKSFLFPLLNVTGFSADSHRSTWLRCEVLIGSSSLWASQSLWHIDIQWHLYSTRFFFFFHPILIRACFLQALKYIVIFSDIFEYAHCIISWLLAIGLLVVAEEVTFLSSPTQAGQPKRVANLNKWRKAPFFCDWA